MCCTFTLGESELSERRVSPGKLYRAALLKNRFADTILKAREKTLVEVSFACYRHPAAFSIYFDQRLIRSCNSLLRLRKVIQRNFAVKGRNLRCRGGKVPLSTQYSTWKKILFYVNWKPDNVNFHDQRKLSCKQKPKLLKKLKDVQKWKLQLRLRGGESLIEKQQDRHYSR